MATRKLSRPKSVPLRVLAWPATLCVVGLVDSTGRVHFHRRATTQRGGKGAR